MKPMLAAEVSPDEAELIQKPTFASIKIDGIRCLNYEREPLTRSFETIPNHHVRSCMREHCEELDEFDGELQSGKNFQETTSAIMTHEGEPEFTYHIFDNIGIGNYNSRFLLRKKPNITFVKEVPQELLTTTDQIKAFFKKCIDGGYEGSVFRRADGKDEYKYGRSTLNESYLVKMVEFVTDEGVIIGLEEGTINTNKLEKDKLGHAKRSSSGKGKIPSGLLGAFIIETKKFGIFTIGTGIGLTKGLRKYILEHPDEYISRMLKYKYKPFGVKDKPRLPISLGFRDKRDM